MNYTAAISDFYKTPHWPRNLLFGAICVLLPIVGPIVLTGDLYHYAAERTLGKIPNNDNTAQTERSRAAIEALLKKTGAQLWIQHDILANATLKKSPQYYE